MILQLHLSHVFDAISFHSMFINKGFFLGLETAELGFFHIEFCNPNVLWLSALKNLT